MGTVTFDSVQLDMALPEIVRSAVMPTPRAPMSHVTVPPVSEQLGLESNVTLVGSLSLTVTPVALEGPWLATMIV